MARAVTAADKSNDAFRTISEVADFLDVPKHVLRFWELKFTQIRPMKRGGGRRFYRPEDVELLRGIQHLLHGEGYTIRGVQKILRRHGVEVVKSCWKDGAAQLRPDGIERASTPSRAVANSLKPGRKPAKAATETRSELSGLRAAIRDLTACRQMLAGLLERDGGGGSRAPG
jgi:DNA-binding transcriptional MerR regulator